MRCSDLIKKLEELAPVSYAMNWDNPGLLAGRSDKEVRKILVALDATDEVIERAVKDDVDMLITHHPLIFSPLKQINDLNFISSRVVVLLQNDISYYAMHTNFDAAPGCMGDLAAGLLDLTDTEVLEPAGETSGGTVYGIGSIGSLSRPMTLEELGRQVKAKFGLSYVTVYGMDKIKEPVTRAAIVPGSGKSMIGLAEKGGAQVMITGDIGHHDGIDAVACGMAVIDAGHYGLEHIFIDFMVSYIKEQIDGTLDVVQAVREFPTVVL